MRGVPRRVGRDERQVPRVPHPFDSIIPVWAFPQEPGNNASLRLRAWSAPDEDEEDDFFDPPWLAFFAPREHVPTAVSHFLAEREMYEQLDPNFVDARKVSVGRQAAAARALIAHPALLTELPSVSPIHLERLNLPQDLLCVRDAVSFNLHPALQLLSVLVDPLNLCRLPLFLFNEGLIEVALLGGLTLDRVPYAFRSVAVCRTAIELSADNIAHLPISHVSLLSLDRCLRLWGPQSLSPAWLGHPLMGALVADHPLWLPLLAPLMSAEQWHIVLTLSTTVPTWMVRAHLPPALAQSPSFIAGVCAVNPGWIVLASPTLIPTVLDQVSHPPPSPPSVLDQVSHPPPSLTAAAGPMS